MRIAVLGVGLIGGSIGLAARRRLDADVTGFDPDPGILERALVREALDRAAGSAGEATEGVEIVFCAAPVGALPDLVEGARWYLTPTERSSGLLYDRLQRAIADLGARPQAIDAATHDRLMATVSHLPHVLANVLASQAAAVRADESERMPDVGRSFRDSTRVAGANLGLWEG